MNNFHLETTKKNQLERRNYTSLRIFYLASVKLARFHFTGGAAAVCARCVCMSLC